MQEQIKTYLSSRDPVLKKIIEQIDWPQVSSTHNVFHDLVGCVIEQQIHYRSSKKTFSKLLLTASVKHLTPHNFSVFEEKALPTLKLSSRKYETLYLVYTFFQTHDPDWKNMEDQEVLKTLSSIKGIGKWTVDMILLYTLERPNIFPKEDYHLKRIMGDLYKINSSDNLTSEMKMTSENWAPFQSFAVKYLLAWKSASTS